MAEQGMRTEPAHRCVDAVVQAGSAATPYRRAGAGPPVLVLAAPAVGEAMLERWSDRFRVLVPVLPRAGVSGSWLRGVIDGLGLVRPRLVVEEPHAAEVLGFVLADPGRVERLAILTRGAAGGVLQDRLAGAGQPILLLGLEPAGVGGAAGARLAAFLAG